MKTFLWEDHIFGNIPFSSVPQISEVMKQSKNKGLLRLSNICISDNEGHWVGWNFPDLPGSLDSQFSLLLPLLSGLAPVHRSHQDQWGWGHYGYYSVANAYQALQPIHLSSLSSAIWHSVWQAPCMPKVNIFIWLLLKNKTLTGENLLKHGFHGPFRCPFCISTSETIDHLLVDCEFSRNAWASVLLGVQITFP